MQTKSSDSPRRWVWLCFAALGCALAILSASGQSIVQNWEGIQSQNDGNPPDPHGAPGPAGIIATVNLRISYYTKAGALLWGPTNLQAFWGSVGNSGNGLSDPKTVFDLGSQRFFVIHQENTGSRFWFNVAVSRSADPRTAGTADWIFYRLDATEYANNNNAGGVNYGGDYPGLAVDAQALYATYRMYAFTPKGSLSSSGSNYLNTALLILNKGQLLNGTGTLVSLYQNAFDLHPVTPRDTNPGDLMYMVDAPSAGGVANSIVVYSVSGPLAARTVSSQTVSITDIGPGPTNWAPQLGSAIPVDPVTGELQSDATLVKGDIWFGRTRGPAAGPAVAAYYRVQLNGWPSSGNNPSLGEEGTVGAATDWNFIPAIGANTAGDLAITWTRSSSTRPAAMLLAWRTAYASTFGAPIVVQTSQAPAIDLDSTRTFSRWGDFFSVSPDPSDGSLWAVSEWTRADTGTWSTWWAQVSMPPRDFFVRWDAPNPGTQDGSLAFPYVTVGAAHANITSGTLHIFGGHYNEQLYLNKAVTLEAYSGGPVTIGAP
jgi:hypothetical protein